MFYEDNDRFNILSTINNEESKQYEKFKTETEYFKFKIRTQHQVDKMFI